MEKKLAKELIEDIIEECITKGEELLKIDSGSIIFSIENEKLFKNFEPGVFLPKHNALVFNEGWLKRSSVDEIRFVTFALVRSFYQYYICDKDEYKESLDEQKWFKSVDEYNNLKDVLDKDCKDFANEAMDFFYK